VSSESVGRHALLDHAARWLQSLLDRGRRSGGLVQSAQSWEAQYAAGRWDFLGELSELARFSILAGYICHLKPGGAVLDAGCGQGDLLRRLPSPCYSRYVGIDLSSTAISIARQQQNERSAFFAVDCDEYVPAERFDVMVFNEVLICLRDPLATVERYTRSLNAGGLLLVSMCTAARGSSTILWRLKRRYATVDEVRIVHTRRKVSWVCSAFRAVEPMAPQGATQEINERAGEGGFDA
jgi:2-polyprenyl-3-methyl-5-hydroxy-6-metoxy-1,4-benzoquinol methylase